MIKQLTISGQYNSINQMTLWNGDCVKLLKTLPGKVAQLVVTSPPYIVGKEYEKNQTLEECLALQESVIAECVRVLKPGGSICWQLGNHISQDGVLVPLDMKLYPVFAKHTELRLRNRIIWHFGHGLHCQRRFSGRYETVLWYTKGDEYLFNLDSVRVPQKYPGKLAFRGPRRGLPTGNPKGKNPGDLWQIPNVKANHIEKTEHPCQFPIALAENLVLALSNKGQLVIDPFLGAGSTAIAALKNGRRCAGAEIDSKYLKIIKERIRLLKEGTIPYRSRTKPIYEPLPNTPLTTPPIGFFSNVEHN